MGLREKVTLVLIAVALYETVCLCAPQSLNENPFEKYLSKLKLGRNRLNSKYDSDNKLKNPRFQNELPDKNMNKRNSDYTSDTSSRIPSYRQSTGYDSSGKTSAIGLFRDTDSLKKFRKEKRKKRKNSPSTQTYTRDDMPVATAPESFHNLEPSFSLSENGLFPEVQYPLTASETWAPNYWNPSTTHKEAVNEDAYFMRGDSINRNKRLKKKDFKSFLQSSAKGRKSILNTEDEITKVSVLNNGQNNNELNKFIINEKNQPTLIKPIESNKTVILNKPQKKKQLKIKTRKRLQPAKSKKNLNSPKKILSESQLSLSQDRNSTNSSNPSIIDSVSTVLKIEQLNEARLLCELEGNITDTLIEKTPDICFSSLTDTHSTSALEDTFNSDLLSERNSRILPITYLDTNFEVNNSSTIEAVVSDPTSKGTLSNDWTKLELLLTDTDSKLPVEMDRKKPIKEFKALQRKKLKDYSGLSTDDSVRRRIFDILLTKKISVSSLQEKILKILQSEEQVLSDIVTEPQLIFIPQNVIQNFPEFSIADNTLKCNVVKATDNEKPCVDDDIYESKLHNINLSNDDVLEILTSIKAISNLESVVAKKTDTFEEVIPETSSTNTPVDNIVETISHAIACNDPCTVILNTSVVNDLNDLNLVPEETKIISEASMEVVPKDSENSIDVIALPIVTEALSDNLRDVISNPSSSRMFIDDLREMIRLLTIWNSQFNETDEKILDSIVEDKTKTDLVNPAATIKHDAKTRENSSNLNISYELTTDLGVIIPKTAATDNGIPQSSRIDTSEIIDGVIKENNNKLAISSHSLVHDNTEFTEKSAIDFGENVDDALSENRAVDSSEMILNFTVDDSTTIAEISTMEVGKTPVKSTANTYDTPSKSPLSNLQETIVETLSAGTTREILNTVKDNHTINDTVPMIESWSSVPQAFTSSDMVLLLANEKEYDVSPTSFTRNNIPIPNTDKVTKQLTETNSSKTIYEPLTNNPITKATLNENFTADYGKADERITNQFITKDHSEPDIYYLRATDDTSISDLLSNKTIAYDYSKTVLQNSSKIGPQFSSDITSDDLGDLYSNYTMYDSLTDTTSTLENPSLLSDIFPSLAEEKESKFPIPYNKTLFSIQNKPDTTQFLSNIVQTGDENSSLNVCPITEETLIKNQCHWSDNLDDLNSTSNFTDIMAGKLQLNSDIEPTELPDISLIDLVMGYAPNSTPEAQFKTTSLPTVCNINALLCDDEIPDFSDYTLSRDDDTTADIIANTVFDNISYFDEFDYSLSLLNDTDCNIFKEAQSTSHIIRTPDFDDKDFTVEKDLTSKPKETYLDSCKTTDMVLPGPDSVTPNEPENELNPHNITDAETNELIADLPSEKHNNTLTDNTFVKSSSDDTTATLTDFDNEALSEEEPDKSNVGNASVNDTVQVKPSTNIELNALETPTAISVTRILDFDEGDSAVEYELTPKPFIHTQLSDLISKENAAVLYDTAFHFVESSSGNETAFTYRLENHSQNDTFDNFISLITPNEDTANTDLNKHVDNLLMNYSDTIKVNVTDETNKKLKLITDITDSEKTSIATYLDSSNTTGMGLSQPDSLTTNDPENELKPQYITNGVTNNILADFSLEEHENTLAGDTFSKFSSDDTTATVPDFDNERLSEGELDKSKVSNESVNDTVLVKSITDIELNTLETPTATSVTRISDFDDGDSAVEYEFTTKPFIHTQPSDLISKENAAVINDTAFYFVESSSANETVFTYGFENHSENDTFDKLTSLITPNENTANIDLNKPVDNLLTNYSDAIEANVVDETNKKITLVEVITDSEKTGTKTYLDSSDTTYMVLSEPESLTTNDPENELKPHNITDAETNDIIADFSLEKPDNTLADDTSIKSSSNDTTATLTDFDNESLSEEETDKSNVGNASLNDIVQVKPIDLEKTSIETYLDSFNTTDMVLAGPDSVTTNEPKNELKPHSIIDAETNDIIADLSLEEHIHTLVDDTFIKSLSDNTTTTLTDFDNESLSEKETGKSNVRNASVNNIVQVKSINDIELNTLKTATTTSHTKTPDFDDRNFAAKYEQTSKPIIYTEPSDFISKENTAVINDTTFHVVESSSGNETAYLYENSVPKEMFAEVMPVYEASTNITNFNLANAFATSDEISKEFDSNEPILVLDDYVDAFANHNEKDTFDQLTSLITPHEDTADTIFNKLANNLLTNYSDTIKVNVADESNKNLKLITDITDSEITSNATYLDSSNTTDMGLSQPDSLTTNDPENELKPHNITDAEIDDIIADFSSEKHDNTLADDTSIKFSSNDTTAILTDFDNGSLSEEETDKSNVGNASLDDIVQVKPIDLEKTSNETYLDSSKTTKEPEGELNPLNITDIKTNYSIADFSSEEHDNTLADDTYIKSSIDNTTATLTDYDKKSLFEEEPDKSNVGHASINNTVQVNPITDIELNTLETATKTSHTRIPDVGDGDFAVEYELTTKPFIYTQQSDLISKENGVVINNTALHFIESSSGNEIAYLYENSVPEEVFAEVFPEYEVSRNLIDFTLANAFATSDEMSKELDSNDSILVPDDYVDGFVTHNENETFDQLTSLITPNDTADTDLNKPKDNLMMNYSDTIEANVTDETNKNLTLIEDITDSEKTSIETYLDFSHTTDMGLSGPDSLTTNDPENELKPQNITGDVINDIFADFSLEKHDNTLTNGTFIKSSSDDTTATLPDFDHELLSEEEPDKSKVSNASVNDTLQVKPITDIELNSLETKTATSATRISDFNDGDSAVAYELTTKPFIHTQPLDLISKENAAVIKDTAFYFAEPSSGNERVFTYGLKNHNENDTFGKLTSLITPNDDTANIGLNKPADNLLMNYSDAIEANVVNESIKKLTLVEVITDLEKTSIETYLDSSNTNDVVLAGNNSITTNEPESELNITDAKTYYILSDFSSEEHDNTLANESFKSSSDDTIATLTDFENKSLTEEESDKSNVDIAFVNYTEQVKPITDTELNTLETKTATSATRISDFDDGDSAVEYELTTKPFIYAQPSDLISKENGVVINNTALHFIESSSGNEISYLYENSVPEEVFAEVLPEYEAFRNLIDFTSANAFATSDEMSKELDSNDSTLVADDYVDGFVTHNENDTFDQLTSLITPNDTADTDLNKPVDNLMMNYFDTIEANVTDETNTNLTLIEDITDSEKTSIETYLDSFNTTDMGRSGPDSLTTNDPENELKPQNITGDVINDILADFSSEKHDNTLTNGTFIKSSSNDTTATLPDFDNELLSEEEPDKSTVSNASVNDTLQVKPITDIELNTLETKTATSATRISDFDDGDSAVEYELTTKPFIYAQPSNLISKENGVVINNTALHFIESSSGNEISYLYENSVPEEVFAEVLPEYEAFRNLIDFTLANAFSTSDEMSKELDSNDSTLVADDYVDGFVTHNENDTFDQLTSLITPNDTADTDLNKPVDNLMMNYFDTIEANVTDETNTNLTLIEDITDSEKTSIETYLDSFNTTDMGRSGPDSLTTNDPENELKPQNITGDVINDILADFSSEKHDNTLTNGTFIKSSSDDTPATLPDFDNELLSEEEPDKSKVSNASVNNTLQVKPTTDIELNTLETKTATSATRISDFDDRNFATKYELTTTSFMYTEPSDLISKQNAAVINDTVFYFLESSSANETAFTYLYENLVPEEVFAEVLPKYEASRNLTDFTLTNAFATSDEMSKEFDSNDSTLVLDVFVDEFANHNKNDTFDFISLITPNEDTVDTVLNKPADNLLMNYFDTIEANVANETYNNFTLIEDVTESEKTNIETYLDSSNTSDMGLSGPDSLTTNDPENELKPQNITGHVTIDIFADFSSEEHDNTLANGTLIKSLSDDTTATLTDFDNEPLSEEEPDKSNADNASLNKSVLVKPITDIELNIKINHTIFDEVATDQTGSNDELTDNNDLDSNTDVKPLYSYEQEVARDSKDYQMTKKLLDGQDSTDDLDDSDRFDTG